MTARTTDPATSHLAATYIAGKRPGLKDAFLMALKALGPSTANEIADWCVKHGFTQNAESVRKRAKELVDEGICKWGIARECKITGLQARTVELNHANSSVAAIEKQPTATERRESTSDSGRSGQSRGHSQSTSSQQVAGVRDQATSQVSTPDTERIQAAAEFVKNERDWVAIFKAAVELSHLSKLGSWPLGDSNDYIQAIESAVLTGLIERSGSNVRAKRAEKETKATQMGLFGDE